MPTTYLDDFASEISACPRTQAIGKRTIITTHIEVDGDEGRGHGRLAGELQALGVGGILLQMAKRRQLLKLRCEMPQCYCPKGRAHFERKEHPPPDWIPTDWIPTPDHYPRLRAHGGWLRSNNVRLAHRLCNWRDYGWRMKINRMLELEMSLEEIAESLNRQKIPPAHGTSKWSAKSVRKAFVS